VTEAEQVLAEVVAAANGLTTVDVTRSYPAVGGRVLRVPSVRSALQARGWSGVSIDDLTSARPLAALAARLVRH
jgi:hypothetical protein